MHSMFSEVQNLHIRLLLEVREEEERNILHSRQAQPPCGAFIRLELNLYDQRRPYVSVNLASAFSRVGQHSC